jgi:GDP-L-fucose synthase
VMDVVGLDAQLVHDTSKPDGTPRKLMSNAKLAEMGWAPTIPLDQGLAQTYRWFLERA